MGTTKTIKIKDIQPDPKNANKGTERGLGLLENSLRQYGAGRSILLDKNNLVIAGNKTLERYAAEMGQDVIVVETEGEQLVAVKRKDLDLKKDKRAKELAIADNRVGQVDLEWDSEMLRSLGEETDLSKFWFPDELEKLFALELPIEGNGGDQFDASPQEGETRAKPGDVWACGRHRVMCGDATVSTDVDALLSGANPSLMVTDPPYGVDYDPEWRERYDLFERHATGKVANDDRIDWSEAFALFPGDVVYCWHAGRHASKVQSSLEQSGFEIRCQLIWVKQHFVFSRGHYHWQHEPCWYAFRKGSSAGWSGDRKQTTVWEIENLNKFGGNKEEEVSGHGTQKPLECMMRPIRNHSGDVYDPFLGSGTTLIAAHRLNRTCYGMEIEPKYIDVCLRRFEVESGTKPEKIC